MPSAKTQKGRGAHRKQHEGNTFHSGFQNDTDVMGEDDQARAKKNEANMKKKKKAAQKNKKKGGSGFEVVPASIPSLFRGYNDDFGDENDEVGTVGGVKFSKKMVKRMNKQKDFQRKGKRSVDEEQQPQQQEQQQDKLAQQPDTFHKTTVEVSRKRKILVNDDNGDEYVVEKTSGGPKRKKFLKRSQIDKDILAINANKGGAVETKKNFIDQSGTLKLIDEIAVKVETKGQKQLSREAEKRVFLETKEKLKLEKKMKMKKIKNKATEEVRLALAKSKKEKIEEMRRDAELSY